MTKSKRIHHIFRGRLIHPLSASSFQEFRDGAIAVDSKGKIIQTGSFAAVKKSVSGEVPIVHFKDQIIIPGLVDCHLHLPQLDQRGKHGATLLEWLKKYIFPAEAAFCDPRVAEDVAKRFFKKMILNGVTTASVYVTVHKKATDIAFEIASGTGLRVIMGKVMMDQHAPSGLGETTSRSLQESSALYEKWHGAAGGRLMYAFTPRFGPTCSEKLWREVGKLMWKTKAYLQTHLSETIGEVERVSRLFPDYLDYTELLERGGCLTPRTLLAHAIYVSPSECRRIAAAGSKIVHCPMSNMFLKSGRMPVEMIEAAGIAYGLGTDIGAGTSMSPFAVMRYADYVQPQINITPTHAFYLATLGGARALSLGKTIGNFEAGKQADFCVVDIRGIDPRYQLDDLTADEILSLLMYRGDGDVVRHTYVDGRRIDVDAIVLKGEKGNLDGRFR